MIKIYIECKLGSKMSNALVPVTTPVPTAYSRICISLMPIMMPGLNQLLGLREGSKVNLYSYFTRRTRGNLFGQRNLLTLPIGIMRQVPIKSTLKIWIQSKIWTKLGLTFSPGSVNYLRSLTLKGECKDLEKKYCNRQLV